MQRYIFVGSVDYSAYCLRDLFTMGVNIVDIMCPYKDVSKFNSDYFDLGEVAKEFGKDEEQLKSSLKRLINISQDDYEKQIASVITNCCKISDGNLVKDFMGMHMTEVYLMELLYVVCSITMQTLHIWLTSVKCIPIKDFIENIEKESL